jgi:taurine dioxygenase
MMSAQASARTTARVTVAPSAMALGADIVGADIPALTEADMAVIRQALADHLVVRFRGAGPSDRDFQAFAARLGPLRGSPDYTRSRPVYMADAPLVTVISNMVEGGRAVGEHGDGELNWHTDLGFEDVPAGFTFLLAREIPASGGNTHFANMYRACAALPDELRAQVARLRCKHQASHNAQGGKRPGYLDIETDDPREMPGPLHPILRTHPITGRQALYLGRRFGAYVPGLTLARSETLLDALWAHAALPENCWAQEWQLGDLVVWDNRCTMHRRDSFRGQGNRRMHRLVTSGERPE